MIEVDRLIRKYQWENGWLDYIIQNTDEHSKTNHFARKEKSKNDARIFALKNKINLKKWRD